MSGSSGHNSKASGKPNPDPDEREIELRKEVQKLVQKLAYNHPSNEPSEQLSGHGQNGRRKAVQSAPDLASSKPLPDPDLAVLDLSDYLVEDDGSGLIGQHTIDRCEEALSKLSASADPAPKATASLADAATLARLQRAFIKERARLDSFKRGNS